MKKTLLVVSMLLFTVPAMAQHSHSHQKGPNGGPIEDVAGVHLEMVTSGKSLTFNVLDESNKPISSTGFSGAALVTAGGVRETITLVAADTVLKGEAKSDIATGTSVSVTVKTADGKSGQARFKK